MEGPPTFRAAPAGPFPQQGRSLVGGRQSGCPRDATDEEIVDPPPMGHANPISPNSVLDLENLDHPCFPVHLDRRALRRLAVHLVVLVPGGAQQFAETQMRSAATVNIETLGQLPPVAVHTSSGSYAPGSGTRGVYSFGAGTSVGYSTDRMVKPVIKSGRWLGALADAFQECGCSFAAA